MSIDLVARRSQLVELRERLLGAAHDLVEDDGDAGEINSAAGDQHIADHASDILSRELDGTLEDNAEGIVHEIDNALRRIDEGTYGTCLRCGGAIPDGRLEAVPYATLCLDCKRIEERGG